MHFQFILFFRFIPADNENDFYLIKLGISKNDPLQAKRNLLLKKLNIENTHEFKLKKGENPLDEKLLAFLRVFNMNEGIKKH